MSKKYNVILDLDQTCISSEEKNQPNKFNPDKYRSKMKQFQCAEMDDLYYVFGRPYLQSFLEFLFENFNVSVWTAATKDYAMFIIEHFLLANKKNRKLDYVFHSEHCDVSHAMKKKTKDLSMLYNFYKIPQFNPNNTFIIDGYKEVYRTQPSRCMFINPFEFKDHQSINDRELITIINILKKILKTNNVDKYINKFNKRNKSITHHKHRKKSKSKSKHKSKHFKDIANITN